MSPPASIEEIVEGLKSNYKTSHFFKIDNFSLIKKHIQRVESSVFHFGGYKWKLFVYPRGFTGVDDHVSIVVEKQVSVNVTLEVELFVVNQLKPIWHSKGPTSLTSDWNWNGDTDLISLDDLERKGYLVKDSCLFGVKFFGIEPARSGTSECFSLIEKPLNHKTTMMLNNFFSLDPEKAHDSIQFAVGNRKWRIQVYPKGCKEGKGKYLSVYLVGEGFINNARKTNTFATFKLRVLDQTNRDHIEKTFSGWLGENPDVKFGFREFMPLKTLAEPYLVKDKIYVGVEFEVISVTS